MAELACVAGISVAAGAALGSVGMVLFSRLTAPRCKPLTSKTAGAHAPMLISEDGTKVLKPLDQGRIEMDNYAALMRTPLRPLLLGFYGERSVTGYEHKYMILDSAYMGMTGPVATLDIKIGRKTWEDLAPPEKIHKESKKFDEIYSQSSQVDGYRVSGMKAGDLVLTAENLKKRHSLTSKEFGEWLLPAFCSAYPGYGALPEGMAGKCRPDARGCAPDLTVAREMLGQLKSIAAVAELGFSGNIRASSVLLTREMRSGGNWLVKLIDLMHYTRSDEGRDNNFCNGIQNLVQVWESWLRVAEA